MSEILNAVLRMPSYLWDDCPLDKAQRHSRYIEAADLIEALTTERDELRAENKELANELLKREAELIESKKHRGKTTLVPTAELDALRTELHALRAKLESGVRVYAERNEFAAHMYECWVIATDKYNATLILDDGVDI